MILYCFYLPKIDFNKVVRDQQGAIAVVKDLKSDENNTVEGAAFILRVLRSENIKTIKAFELLLPSYEADATFRKADLCYETGGILKIVDGKSYLPKAFNTQLKKGGDKHFQFLDYFRNITNINQLEFWFDAEKIPDGETVYNLFLNVMTSGPMFRSELTLTGEAWFKAIWGNITLRNNLFPAITSETEGRKAFIRSINIDPSNTKSLLFFMKVKPKI